jgi:hypothetical protein
MKYLFVLLTIFFVTTFSSLSGQWSPQKISQSENKIQAQLTAEYSLDKPNIVRATFSAPGLGNDAFPSCVVLEETRPDGRVGDSEIIFYDASHNVTCSRKLGEDTSIERISEYGNYAVLSTDLKQVSKTQNRLFKIELLNSRGKVFWTKQIESNIETSLPAYYISEAGGSTVESIDMLGTLNFYDPQGNLRNTTSLYKEEIWTRNRYSWGKFSANGKYFVINASDDPGQTFQYQAGIILFDKQGNEKWRFQYGDGELASPLIDISPSGKYVLASTQNVDYTYLLNSSGQLISKIHGLGSDKIFSDDEKYFFIKQGNGIRLFTSESGNLLIDVGTRRGLSVYAASISYQTERVGLLSYKLFKDYDKHTEIKEPEVEIYNFKGERIGTIPIDDEIGATIANFQFSDNGKCFTTTVGAKVKKYSIIENE